MSNKSNTEPHVDYEFYYDHGGALPEETFEKNRIWATALMDQITFGRLKRLEVIPTCVKQALCSTVDRYDRYQDRQKRNMKSESLDGYSVSYADDTKLESFRSDAICEMKMFLADTGLTYRGRSQVYDCRSEDDDF